MLQTTIDSSDMMTLLKDVSLATAPTFEAIQRALRAKVPCMAGKVPRVFFSFHYEKDAWRAAQVRNSWVTKPSRRTARFWDAVAWEKVKRKGDTAIRRWIGKQLESTSVTVVLIGEETAERDYVLYEIEQSLKRGNGILGVYIHNVKDSNGNTSAKGENPFGHIRIALWRALAWRFIFRSIPTYDWIQNNGYSNLGKWIEQAAKDAGR